MDILIQHSGGDPIEHNRGPFSFISTCFCLLISLVSIEKISLWDRGEIECLSLEVYNCDVVTREKDYSLVVLEEKSLKRILIG